MVKAIIIILLLLMGNFEPDCWEPDLEEEYPCEAEGWCER